MLLLLITTFCCYACGPRVIEGRPPFISISGISQVEDRLVVEFDIRNQNGIPMNLDEIDVILAVEAVHLVNESRKIDLVIGANSAEHFEVDGVPDQARRSLLESLERGEVNSLPFDLRGKVHTAEDGSLSFDHKGYMYPVPGKPGHFRAAVTQAQGLQREEKL